MRLIVMGASGRVGRHVVQQAVERGSDVFALARTPANVPPGVTTTRLDLADTTVHTVARTLRSDDVVISCLGATGRADVGIAASGTRLLLAAMTLAGARRLISISAAPVAGMLPHSPAGTGEDVLTRRLLNPILRRALRGAYCDLAAMETELVASPLDWTIVRPPRLTDGPLTRRYRTATSANLRHGRSISRAHLAHLITRLAQDPTTIRQHLAVAY